MKVSLQTPRPACVTADVKKPGSPPPPFDATAAAERLRALSIDELRSRFIKAFNLRPDATRGFGREHLIKRLVFAKQEEHRLARDEEKRIAHEQAMRIGVATGTHCLLRCEGCWSKRIVPLSTRKKLLRLAQQGRRPKFLCADCRDRYRRRSGERAAIKKTVADIKRKGNRR